MRHSSDLNEMFNYYMNEDAFNEQLRGERDNEMKTRLNKKLSKSLAPFIVKNKLTDYMVLDTILTSKINIILPFHSEVNVGDLIELTLEFDLNGMYKIICMGSDLTPWVLERID